MSYASSRWEMLTDNSGYWLRYYKRKCFFKNYVFYFLKLKKNVTLNVDFIFFLFILSCLTSASGLWLTQPDQDCITSIYNLSKNEEKEIQVWYA